MGTISTATVLGFIIIIILDSDRLMRRKEKLENKSFLDALISNYHRYQSSDY